MCYADGVMDLYLGCYITVASIVPIGCRVYKAFIGIWQIVLTLSLSKRNIMTTLHAHTGKKGYLKLQSIGGHRMKPKKKKNENLYMKMHLKPK